MRLFTCIACPGLLPPNASLCPHCGARVPRGRLSRATAALVALAGGASLSATLMACYGIAVVCDGDNCGFGGSGGTPTTGSVGGGGSGLQLTVGSGMGGSGMGGSGMGGSGMGGSGMGGSGLGGSGGGTGSGTGGGTAGSSANGGSPVT